LGKKYIYLYMSTYNNYLIFKEGIVEEGWELDHLVSHYFTFMVKSLLIKCNGYLFQRAKTFGWWPHCNLSTNFSFLQRKTTLPNVKQSNPIINFPLLFESQKVHMCPMNLYLNFHP
jgi:hypothetical protein